MKTTRRQVLLATALVGALALGLFAIGATFSASAHAKMSAENLAKLSQNPVGNVISLPFPNNTNLNFGPEKGMQNVLNIQFPK